MPVVPAVLERPPRSVPNCGRRSVAARRHTHTMMTEDQLMFMRELMAVEEVAPMNSPMLSSEVMGMERKGTVKLKPSWKEKQQHNSDMMINLLYLHMYLKILKDKIC